MYKVIRFQFLKSNFNFYSSAVILCGTGRSFSILKVEQRTQPKTCNYTVEEIKIPVPSLGGHLAGKLWQGPKANFTHEDRISSPPIICLHGHQDNCGTFNPLIPLILKDDMKVFTMDLPGHGHSYRNAGLSYDFYLDGMTSIKRTLRHFGWEKATLLGHSLGSIISFVFSGTFPEQVHKYIALDNLRPVPGKDIRMYYQRILKTISDVERKIDAGTERPMYTYNELLQRTYLARKKTVTLEGCEALLIRGSEKVEGTDRYRFTHDLKTNASTAYRLLGDNQTKMIAEGIKCPVCIIKGEPGEDYEPREDYLKMVDFLAERNGKVEFHLVPGTHHFHLNEPHLVAPIISKFLES